MWLAMAWPASWIAVARAWSSEFLMFCAVPDSIVVMASTTSGHSNAARPSECA